MTRSRSTDTSSALATLLSRDRAASALDLSTHAHTAKEANSPPASIPRARHRRASTRNESKPSLQSVLLPIGPDPIPRPWLSGSRPFSTAESFIMIDNAGRELARPPPELWEREPKAAKLLARMRVPEEEQEDRMRQAIDAVCLEPELATVWEHDIVRALSGHFIEAHVEAALEQMMDRDEAAARQAGKGRDDELWRVPEGNVLHPASIRPVIDDKERRRLERRRAVFAPLFLERTD